MRGSVPRTQTNPYAKSSVNTHRKIGIFTGKKKMLVSRLMNKMFMYSAIKINANVPPLYSVLNPETSSDSPSAKSNGARFVSARADTNQIIISGNKSRNSGGISLLTISFIFIVILQIIGLKRIRIILTSYEIVWAIPRIAPNRAYLEFEAQPAASTE